MHPVLGRWMRQCKRFAKCTLGAAATSHSRVANGFGSDVLCICLSTVFRCSRLKRAQLWLFTTWLPFNHVLSISLPLRTFVHEYFPWKELHNLPTTNQALKNSTMCLRHNFINLVRGVLLRCKLESVSFFSHPLSCCPLLGV